MADKILHAVYDDDDKLMHAVKDLRAANFSIEEVYTPFPVHGLDKALGLKPTRLAILSFIYGCIGFSFAIFMMNYIMIVDWPQNIGGKPSFSFIENMPSFVPIMFELTVFFAAHLMVITFYLRSKLWPFKEAENPLPTTTDDKFLIEIKFHGDGKSLKAAVKKTDVFDINIIDNTDSKKMKKITFFSAMILMSLLTISCFDQSKPNYQFFPNMYESVGYSTYQESDAFANGIEAQLPADGTIPRGWVPYDYPDTNEGYELAKKELLSPLEVNDENLSKGKELYNIYCAVCHGSKGDGQGILMKREKFLGIPSYADREITEGSTYHVLMYGKNLMGSHASQVNAEERWQISQYVMSLREKLIK